MSTNNENSSKPSSSLSFQRSKLGQLVLPVLEDQSGLLSDDMKMEAAKGVLKKQLLTGDSKYLTQNDPLTCALKKSYQFSDLMVSPDKHLFRDKLSESYLQKKMFQPDPWCAPVSKSESGARTTHKKLISRPSSHPNQNPPATSTTISVGSGSVLRTTNPRTAQRAKKTLFMESNQEALPEKKQKNITHTSVWSKDDMTVFDNVSQAEQVIGPCYTSNYRDRTSGAAVPTGWSSRTYRCLHHPHCERRWLLVSPTLKLASAPAHLYTRGEHSSHSVKNWMDWYEYKLEFQAMETKGYRVKWNESEYPIKPGLPPFIGLHVEHLVNQPLRVLPAAGSRTVLAKVEENELFKLEGAREYIQRQVKEKIRNHYKSAQKMKSQPCKNQWDWLNFNTSRRLCQERLLELIKSGELIRKKPLNDVALYEYGMELTQFGVLPRECLVQPTHPHRAMFVLDDPQVRQNPHYLDLCRRKKEQPKDPADKLLIATSLALLSNICHAERLDWMVQAASDGQHCVTRADYKLIILVLIHINEDGQRSAYPVAFGVCKEEKEVSALLIFLNIKKVVQDLFGIKMFGGYVSDHSAVYINSFRTAFGDDALLLQCWAHILRKFKITERDGNGQYLKYLSSKDPEKIKWLRTTAHDDVDLMQWCLTEKSFRVVGKLVYDGWVAAGEEKLADVFFKQYVNDDLYNNWRYSASGIHGCCCSNNPLEAFNLQVKGSNTFLGLVPNHKAEMGQFLHRELPECIAICSAERVGVKHHYPSLNMRKCSTEARISDAYSCFDFQVDTYPIQQSDGRTSWLVNDFSHFGRKVTPEDHIVYHGFHRGEVTVDYSDRKKLSQLVKRFHHVEENPPPAGTGVSSYYTCSCRDFYNNQWCYPTLFFQHRERLEELCAPIEKSNKRKKMSKTAIERKHFLDANHRIAMASRSRREAQKAEKSQSTKGCSIQRRKGGGREERGDSGQEAGWGKSPAVS